jgi:hypothetical protein
MGREASCGSGTRRNKEGGIEGRGAEGRQTCASEESVE